MRLIRKFGYQIETETVYTILHTKFNLNSLNNINTMFKISLKLCFKLLSHTWLKYSNLNILCLNQIF